MMRRVLEALCLWFSIRPIGRMEGCVSAHLGRWVYMRIRGRDERFERELAGRLCSVDIGLIVLEQPDGRRWYVRADPQDVMTICDHAEAKELQKHWEKHQLELAKQVAVH